MARLFRGVRPVTRPGVIRGALAGLSLAAMSVPQALGYARIAGAPAVTGLYTLLMPLVAFATLGSSRYLVVAADSATAAILAGGLAGKAPLGSAHYMALAGVVALLTAAGLLVARLFKLGFLADFLSQTVLVGFLTGIGVQVGIAMLGEMLGISVDSTRTLGQVVQIVRSFPRAQVATSCLAGSVVATILILQRYAPRLPGPLIAVVAATAASAGLNFSDHGIALIPAIPAGLPSFGLPRVTWRELPPLLPLAGGCFLMVVAQSAATARAYATRHHQTLDENADLVGLSAANAVAALTGTFVVNGSPTQTAMVDRAGGRSQVAPLATAAVVTLILLFLTGPLRFLPQCVLGAVVFTIAVGLVDLRGLRAILRESPGELRLALLTAIVVIVIGVEQGIVMAIVLSLLRHVRHSYLAHTAVLIQEDGQWHPIPALPGAVSGPGLIVFQFGSDLFYANASRFAGDVRALVEGASSPVQWLVVDAGAITSIDYSAARVVEQLQRDLHHLGVTLVLVHAEPSLLSDLRRHRLQDVIAAGHVFETLREALSSIRVQQAERGPA